MGVVYPSLPNGGNGEVQTAAVGTNYTALATEALGKKCSQVTFFNNTGTKISVRQDGAGVAVTIFDQTYYTFYGIKNTSQLGVRRTDTDNAQVTIQYRWEG